MDRFVRPLPLLPWDGDGPTETSLEYLLLLREWARMW